MTIAPMVAAPLKVIGPYSLDIHMDTTVWLPAVSSGQSEVDDLLPRNWPDLS